MTGIETVQNLVNAVCQVVGVGEVGIANTTTSAAVYCALRRSSRRGGRGSRAGLSDDGFKRKIAIVDGAVSNLQPDPRM